VILENIPVLLSAALPLMASPGPATLALFASGAAYGWRRALPFLSGVCLGVMGILLAVATGLTGLVLAVPGVFPVLGGLALVYLGYLAWRIATAPVDGTAPHEHEAAPTFSGGLVVAVANPKAYAAMATAFSATNLVAADLIADGLVKYAVIAAAIWSVNTTWLVTGTLFATMMTKSHMRRALNRVFAVLIVLSIGAIIWSELKSGQLSFLR